MITEKTAAIYFAVRESSAKQALSDLLAAQMVIMQLLGADEKRCELAITYITDNLSALGLRGNGLASLTITELQNRKRTMQ